MNDASSTTPADSLALALFSKSVMKQAKLAAITRLLPPVQGRTCLDIGGDNGAVSFFLRRLGGEWTSADLTEEAVAAIRELVGDRCLRLDGGAIPLPDHSFDLVVVIDFLEHIPDDRGFVSELRRILRDDGTLVVNVPHRKRWSAIRPLRLALGLTDEQHGHLRPGYSRQELDDLLAPGFHVVEQRTYSRFVSELVDAALSFVYTKVGRGKGRGGGKGVMVTGQDVRKGGMYRIFAALYPVIWLVTRLDWLFFFTRGHCLVVRAVPAGRFDSAGRGNQ